MKRRRASYGKEKGERRTGKLQRSLASGRLQKKKNVLGRDMYSQRKMRESPLCIRVLDLRSRSFNNGFLRERKVRIDVVK
jgi:hypothetical protein